MTPGPRRRLDPFGWEEWPESRPAIWHALAAVEKRTRFASAFGNRRDAVLLYHSIGGIPGIDYKWDVPVSVFREQIRHAADRYDVVDLETLATTNDPSRKRVAITFDDGFRNVYENALPVLREFDAPATLFVCPAFLDEENSERMRARHDLGAEARDISMTTKHLRDAADDDRFMVGNHTFSHPDLSTLPDRDALEDEILEARDWLEDRLDVSVDCFSYPYGAYDERAAAVVADTHDIAVTSDPSLIKPSGDPRSIPRLDTCLPVATACFEMTDLSARLRTIARALGGRFP